MKNPAAKQLRQEGWKVTTRRGGHLLAVCPQGHCRVVISNTPSDWRTPKNEMSRARREHASCVTTQQTGQDVSIKPSVETIQRYADAVAYLKAHPNTPFNGYTLKGEGNPHAQAVMDRVGALTTLTYRLADGGARTSSEMQKFWDELDGGLVYQTERTQYVYDTSAKLGKRGILGNQWPVVVKGRIEWEVKALEETGVGTARVVTPPAELSVVKALELVADHGTHLVVRVGSEVVVCEVLSRGGKS